MKRLTAVFSAFLCVFMLASCDKTVKLEYNENHDLVDEKNGITYITAPLYIEPIVTSAKVYGKTETREFYEIEGLDPEVWLAEAYASGGTVYCSDSSLDEIDISDFEANNLVICVEDVNTIGLAHVENPEEVKAIVEAFLNGEETEHISGSNGYDLKFSSDKYKGLYFALEYCEADNGENYIFNRYTKECRSVGDALQKYMPRG